MRQGALSKPPPGRMMAAVKRPGSLIMHDIVIRGGTIIDGSGKSAFTVDVAIADGRLTGAEAETLAAQLLAPR